MIRAIDTVSVTCSFCGGSSAQDIAQPIDYEYRTCTNLFYFVRCNSCSMVYLKNRPAISELEQIYPKTYGTYTYNEFLGPFITRIRHHVQRLKIRHITRHLPANGLVVDIGCGNGDLLRLLRRHGDPSLRLIGVDFADQPIRDFSQLGIETRIGRFETMDWRDPAPHAVIMNQVIEHVEDPTLCTRRIFQMLRFAGRLIIETPSLDGWDAKLFRKHYWAGWHCPRHWSLFTAGTLTRLLIHTGFQIVDTQYLLHPYAWLLSLKFFIREELRQSKLASYFDVNHIVPLALAGTLDLIQKAITRKTSNIRMVAIKPLRSA